MKIKRTVEHPAYTTEVVDKKFCDLCKTEIAETVTCNGNIDDVVIQYICGYKSSDYSDYEIMSVDMCGGCFSSEFVPWLEKYRAEVQIQNIEF